MAKLSVIIPVYNVEKYLRECLDSVVNQTLKDIEIIVLNDGSKDNCLQIINEFKNKYSNIIVIDKQNGGYGHTCNLGLSKATGDYVAILEPDDYIEPDMYETLLNRAIETNSDIAKSQYYENYTQKFGHLKKVMLGGMIDDNEVFKLQDHPELLNSHPSIWSCIYRREFLTKHNIKFIEAKGAGWTDNLFQIQTLYFADKITFINRPLYYWRKINFDSSKDLKDFTVPINRTLEIHNWLKDKNIADENLLVQLFKRELSYINVINRMIKFKNIPRYLEFLQDFWTLVNSEKLITRKEITKKEFKFYKKMIKSPILEILSDKSKLNFINLRFSSKRENYIILFGQIVWTKEKRK